MGQATYGKSDSLQHLRHDVTELQARLDDLTGVTDKHAEDRKRAYMGVADIELHQARYIGYGLQPAIQQSVIYQVKTQIRENEIWLDILNSTIPPKVYPSLKTFMQNWILL